MTFFSAFVWSLGRSLAVATIGLLLASRLQCVVNTSDGWRRRLLWAGVLLPVFVPGLLIGYGYRNFTLSLVHHPLWNELTYAGLTLLTVVPVGTLILICSPPPPVSDAARHAAQLMLQNGSLHTRTSMWMRSRLFALLPAWAVMFLLSFQETEVATLMQAKGWPEWTFTRLATGLPLTPTLLHLMGPITIQLAVISAALTIVLSGSHDRAAADRRTPDAEASAGPAWAYGVAATVLLLLLPGWFVLRGTITGFAVLAAHPALMRQIGIALLFGMTAGLLAWMASGVLVRCADRGVGLIVAGLCLLPGLLGAWALGLALAGLFQRPMLRPLLTTPLPMILGEVLFQLPRAVLVRLLVGKLIGSTAAHSAVLLSAAPDRFRRHRAGDILWRLDTRGRVVGGMIVGFWSYMELSIPSPALLGPPGMTTAPVLLYNQMHYGQIPGLSALVFATIAVPVVLLTGLTFVAKPLALWLGPSWLSRTR